MELVMHVNVKETLTVTKTVTEQMQLHLRQTLAEANFPLPVSPEIPAMVILTVTMIVTEQMQSYSRLILAGVPLEIPVLPVLWKSGAVINNGSIFN